MTDARGIAERLWKLAPHSAKPADAILIEDASFIIKHQAEEIANLRDYMAAQLDDRIVHVSGEKPMSAETVQHLNAIADAACRAMPATSLAAQDGLVEALRKVQQCLRNGKDPSGLLYSSAWIVSQLNGLIPEIDAALSAIKGDKS